MNAEAAQGWGRSGYADAHGVKLHYVRGGNGPPLLLLHGWPQTWREWDAVAPALTQDFDVIALDLPGLGGSDPLPGGYSKRNVAAHIAGMLEDLAVGPATVIGHDMGAATAFALAGFHPEKVERLVALDMLLPGFGLERMLDLSGGQGLWHFAFHQPPGMAEMLVAGRERAYFGWFFEEQAGAPGAVPAEAMNAYVAAYARPASLSAGFGYYRSILDDAKDNARFATTKIGQPVTCIGGERGTGAWMAKSFESACRLVSAHVLAGCGHWIPEERPAELLELLRAKLHLRT